MTDWLATLGAAVFCGLAFWAISSMTYRVDQRFVRVMLGRVTLRKVLLSDIAFADTAAPFWNEHWCNTLFARGRVVRLRRKSGWIKNFIITPAARDDFLQQLRAHLDARTLTGG